MICYHSDKIDLSPNNGKGVRMKPANPRHALDTYNWKGVEIEMSNALVRAADRLNLTSKRLVWACIAEANKRVQWMPGQALIVRLSAADYMAHYGVDQSNAYKDLKRCAKDLEEEKIIFRRPSRRGKGVEEVHMRWVGRATYNEGEGWVEVAFWHEVVPHLVRLRTEYTQIKLQQASALRSRYSWDLLRLLSQFKSTGRLSIELEEFQHSMNAPESCRKDFKDLRRRILEPAIRELRDKDGLLVKCVPKKIGRKVIGLDFTFEPSPQQELFQNTITSDGLGDTAPACGGG
jgi:plasmid replication initiation protein